MTKGSHEKVEVVCSSKSSLLVLPNLNNVHRNGIADRVGLLGGFKMGDLTLVPVAWMWCWTSGNKLATVSVGPVYDPFGFQ